MISVIIPCFNSEQWIKETLDSVYRQNTEIIEEIIVIDDGSTDNSRNLVEDNYPEVNLISTKNQGPSKARNLGIDISKGQYIQFLDADDLLADNKLEVQLKSLENTGLGVAYGNWIKFNSIVDNYKKVDNLINKEMQNPEIDLSTDFWCPPAVYLLKREIVEKVGGFKENLPVIQDARFMLDCAILGAEFIYCNELMAYYRVHSDKSISTTNKKLFLQDCFNNAIEIEKIWLNSADFNDTKKNALCYIFAYVAKESFNSYNELYDSSINFLNKYSENYSPSKSSVGPKFYLSSKLIGFENTIKLSNYIKKTKAKLHT